MCGIAGIVNPHPINLVDRVRRMCDCLAHRGPDDFGMHIWNDHQVGLGHRRLSIIDLTSAGHNPMSNEDGTVWIVFNGEIYNFRALRRELEHKGHTFYSNTDTEVILHAYEAWGDEHVHRLRGMFAYAIYDRRSDLHSNRNFRFLLVRDRLGIKPLFYYWNRGCLLFASELKAILSSPEVDRRLNDGALVDYFTYLYIPGPKTAYQKIHKLLPGHLLIYEDQQMIVRKYWDINFERKAQVRDEEEAFEILREALRDSVKLHMLSDVPLGVFLSGGLDSSTVASLVAGESQEPVHTFSIGFDIEEHSELEYARLVASQFNTHHFERFVGSNAFQPLLPKIVSMYDEPYADGSAIPTYRLSTLASESVKAALSGDGGDEVFAGYKRYSKWLKRQKLRSLPAYPFIQGIAPWMKRYLPRVVLEKHAAISDLELSPFHQYARLVELFSPEEKRNLFTPDFFDRFKEYDDYWSYRLYWVEEIDPITRLQYLDLKTYLPDDILTKIDRASMAVSLEVRPPLLDHELVELVFAIRPELRVKNQERKYLLKNAVKNDLPTQILHRDKKGFSAPWKTWLEDRQNWVKEFVSKGEAVKQGVIHPKAVEFIGQRNWGLKLWSLLVFEQWFNTRVISNSSQ